MISTEKRFSESEVTHKELVEVSECVKVAHKKTEVKLTQLKSCLADERRTAKDRELELLTEQNCARDDVIRLRLKVNGLKKMLWKKQKSHR